MTIYTHILHINAYCGNAFHLRLCRRNDSRSSHTPTSWHVISRYDDVTDTCQSLRSATEKAKTPCVPFLGVWLQDLVFIGENPTLLSEGHVNFGEFSSTFRDNHVTCDIGDVIYDVISGPFCNEECTEKMEMYYNVLEKVRRCTMSEYKLMPMPTWRKFFWAEVMLSEKVRESPIYNCLMTSSGTVR